MSHASREFMPITDEDRVHTALEHVAAQAAPLARAAIGLELTVDVLCLFAQSLEEHEIIQRALSSLGQRTELSRDEALYADTAQNIGGHFINLLGVREPDEGRHWIGYAYYPIRISQFPALLAGRDDDPNVHRLLSGRGEPLIGLQHPDFDTVGYLHDPAWAPQRG